jgi:hypothetical protein
MASRPVLEPNPPQPEHPRKVRVIAPDEAAVVVRIFEFFADGMALKKIAALLRGGQWPRSISSNSGGSERSQVGGLDLVDVEIMEEVI